MFAGSTALDGSADPIPLDTEPPSLVDEGLRIARQYGLGADFESELEGLKKVTNPAAATQDADVGVKIEGTESSTTLSSTWNNNTAAGVADHGAGMADDDDVQMIT